jgi:hypothetical protein
VRGNDRTSSDPEGQWSAFARAHAWAIAPAMAPGLGCESDARMPVSSFSRRKLPARSSARGRTSAAGALSGRFSPASCQGRPRSSRFRAKLRSPAESSRRTERATASATFPGSRAPSGRKARATESGVKAGAVGGTPRGGGSPYVGDSRTALDVPRRQTLRNGAEDVAVRRASIAPRKRFL